MFKLLGMPTVYDSARTSVAAAVAGTLVPASQTLSPVVPISCRPRWQTSYWLGRLCPLKCKARSVSWPGRLVLLGRLLPKHCNIVCLPDRCCNSLVAFASGFNSRYSGSSTFSRWVWRTSVRRSPNPRSALKQGASM